MIYYYCPDIELISGGIRRLYRHVAILRKHGFDASILHVQKPFCRRDLPSVPISWLSESIPFDPRDIIVFPEGYPQEMFKFKDAPVRKFAIALNWHYIYSSLPDQFDWRFFNLERVIVISKAVGEMIEWAMKIPTHTVATSVSPDMYVYKPEEKQNKVVFIKRKSEQHAACLARLIQSASPAVKNSFEWKELHALSEEDYAKEINTAKIFLNLSLAEGIPQSCFEAMRAGTLVAGYNSVGGRYDLVGEGENQNAVVAPNGDYPVLARKLEPLMHDLSTNSKDGVWFKIIRNGRKYVSRMSPQNEETSLTTFWRSVL